MTIPPFGGHASWSPADQVSLETLNAHVRATFTADPRVRLVEVYDTIRNPASYGYLPAFNFDLLHTSPDADVLIAGMVRDALIDLA